MPVKFQKVQANDKQLPSNVENVHRFFHSFASIHDMQFDNAFSMSLTGWTTDSGLTTVIQAITPLYDDQISEFGNEVMFE